MQIWVDNEQAVVFQKGTCVNSKLKGTFDMRLQWIGELKADNIVQGAKVDRENNGGYLEITVVIRWGRTISEKDFRRTS